MEVVIKIDDSLEESKNETKSGFLPMLLGTLAATLLGSALTGQCVIRADQTF